MRNLILVLACLPGVAAAQGTFMSPRAFTRSSCAPGQCAVQRQSVGRIAAPTMVRELPMCPSLDQLETTDAIRVQGRSAFEGGRLGREPDLKMCLINIAIDLALDRAFPGMPEIEPPTKAQSCIGPLRCSSLGVSRRGDHDDDNRQVWCLTKGEKARHNLTMGFVGGMLGMAFDTRMESGTSLAPYAVVLGLVVGHVQSESKPTCPFRTRNSSRVPLVDSTSGLR